MFNMRKGLVISILLSLFTIVIIVYRDLVNNNIPFYIFSILCILTCIFSNSSGRVLYITALLPFCRGIPFSEMLLIMLLIELLFGVIQKKMIIKPKQIVPIILIIVIELINYLYYDVFSDVVIYLTLYMFFVAYVVSNKLFEGSERKILIIYGISTSIAILSVIIREINLYGLDYIFSYNVRFGANVEGLKVTSFNANELGLYCSVAVSALLVSSHYKKNILLLIFAAVLSLLGIVSVSRTYLFIIMLTWVLYLLMSRLNIKKICLISICFFVLIASLFATIPDFMNWITEFLTERSQNITEGGLNGRIELFDFYNNKITNSFWSLLFGYSQKYLSITRGNEASHNAIQEIIVCWGLTGLTICVYWIYNLYKSTVNNIRKSKIKIIYFLPMIVFILFIQSIQLFTMNCYLVVLLISIIPLSMKKEHCNE